MFLYSKDTFYLGWFRGWILYSKLKLYMKRFDLDVFIFFPWMKGGWLLIQLNLLYDFSPFPEVLTVIGEQTHKLDADAGQV